MNPAPKDVQDEILCKVAMEYKKYMPAHSIEECQRFLTSLNQERERIRKEKEREKVWFAQMVQAAFDQGHL